MEISSPKNKTFQGGTLQSQKIKKAHSKKISYISRNRILCQEGTCIG